MIPFLKQVAGHYSPEEDMERLCFVFPNRRSQVFFRKYLGEEVASRGVPAVSPGMFSMNEFFYAVAGFHDTDRVNLLVELYGCYKELNPKGEELDEFLFWGGVLLSDFDDVDKYLVNPEHIFTNVADFKGMQDSYSYLSETQREAVERFAGHFRTGGKYKDEFRRIWDILLPLYRNFNARLLEKGMCYEGQVYRSLAERLRTESVADLLAPVFPGTRRYVFVGLNALNECEKSLLKRLRDAGMAEFCWDYSGGMIKDGRNKSSFFMQDNVAAFPQAFEPDGAGLPETEFNVVSVPSAVGQAKQLPEIFRRIGAEGMETAVVLPDESLLLPVLNSIPEELKGINVTMGWSGSGSELWSLMNDISLLQLRLREKDGKWYFYHRQVWAIFSNSVLKSVLGDAAADMVNEVRKSAKYYIEEDAFKGDPLLALIFKPVVKNPSVADAAAVTAVCEYQQHILSAIGFRLGNNAVMALELDFAKVCWEAVARLKACGLSVRPATYFRLLGQVMNGAAVPFKGEPLAGLQIMGPLETRALDFDNVIIMSCNEGMFPRRSVASSFIPPELRKGFGLPTYEYQDAVWAYYFYRMIQRAGKVWMLFDSRTEISRSGEESRYIKQLELHFGVKVNRYVANAGIRKTESVSEIPKTEEDIRKIHSGYLSASSLQDYMACPAKFYYRSVRGLYADAEVSESLDAGMQGTVFHRTMEEIYSVPGGIVEKSRLRSVLRDKEGIRKKVSSKIMEQLHTFEVTGRNIIFEDIVCRYVAKVLERDIELMESRGVESLRILGLELKRTPEMYGFRFKGSIDRLDSLSDGEVRVVDYKTGRLDDTKVGLQLYLYDSFIRDEFKDATIVNSVYHLSSLFVSPVKDILPDDDFRTVWKDTLEQILAEIDDVQVPFRLSGDDNVCKWCDFKMICGK